MNLRKSARLSSIKQTYKPIPRRSALKCPLCLCRFINQQYVDYHLDKSHTEHFDQLEQQSFKCKYCNVKASKRKKIISHVKFAHRKERNKKNVLKEKNHVPKCQLCQKEFKRTSSLTNHLKNMHGWISKEAIRCPVCFKPYVVRSLLIKHMYKFHPTADHNGFMAELNEVDRRMRLDNFVPPDADLEEEQEVDDDADYRMYFDNFLAMEANKGNGAGIIDNVEVFMKEESDLDPLCEEMLIVPDIKLEPDVF